MNQKDTTHPSAAATMEEARLMENPSAAATKEQALPMEEGGTSEATGSSKNPSTSTPVSQIYIQKFTEINEFWLQNLLSPN
jgi:hypothetical protein